VTIDPDLIKINDAFAPQVIPSARDFGADSEGLSASGAAIAFGHQLGMTGAPPGATLVNSLQGHDKQFGLEIMCTAGGQKMAILLDQVS
jgi:acetyl-CoA C-acetyltransferase